MKIEVYYDLCCALCCRHYSTDYGYGMETSKERLRRVAKTDGWIYNTVKKENICPQCAKLLKQIHNSTP